MLTPGGLFYWIFLTILRKIGWTLPKYTAEDHEETLHHAAEQFERLSRQR